MCLNRDSDRRNGRILFSKGSGKKCCMKVKHFGEKAVGFYTNCKIDHDSIMGKIIVVEEPTHKYNTKLARRALSQVK